MPLSPGQWSEATSYATTPPPARASYTMSQWRLANKVSRELFKPLESTEAFLWSASQRSPLPTWQT